MKKGLLLSALLMLTLLLAACGESGVITEDDWESISTDISSKEIINRIGEPSSETTNRNQISGDLEGYSSILNNFDSEKLDTEKIVVATLLEALSEKKNVKKMSYKIKSDNEEDKEVDVYLLNDSSVLIK
ncbi:hypothetical protein [Listeria booriae]|uniref:hypothetical protein n=1 Tax=Listeria booriae TaxID=1552123 RepID=UPI001625F1EE|nr:hypothetical protein [Listeria booriae]MBC1801004.1 hypothetical protein [Listeria booriae]